MLANEYSALILDTRDAQTFAASFIPNAINIGIDGNFAPWVGALVPDIQQPILLVTDEGREEEVVTRLARVGFDHTLGYLKGGMEAWQNASKETDHIQSIAVDQLAQEMAEGKPVKILDVRKKMEYLAEHIMDAENLPLNEINRNMSEIDKNVTYFVHCAGGYRSMIFNSLLRARGYHNLIDIKGGFKAIKESGKLLLSNYVCPSTLI
jgi:rhodanese-related sulfurtransferase